MSEPLEPFNPQKVKEMTCRKEAVRYLLRHIPQLRGDDRLLVPYFYRYFHSTEWTIDTWDSGQGVKNLTLNLQIIRNGKLVCKFFTSFETITRIRRKLQEEDATLRPSIGVQVKRDAREETIRFADGEMP